MIKTGTSAPGTTPPSGDRRARTRAVVDKLLAERSEMLVLYSRMAGLAPYGEGHRSDELQRRFCQLLVDYVAAGHFGLYQRITNGTERRQEVARVAERVYPRISETTEAAVAYSDKYEGKPFEPSEGLKADLSHLGEEIAARIELEDELIAALLR
jgi:regulator of sigma D